MDKWRCHETVGLRSDPVLLKSCGPDSRLQVNPQLGKSTPRQKDQDHTREPRPMVLQPIIKTRLLLSIAKDWMFMARAELRSRSALYQGTRPRAVNRTPARPNTKDWVGAVPFATFA